MLTKHINSDVSDRGAYPQSGTYTFLKICLCIMKSNTSHIIARILCYR